MQPMLHNCTQFDVRATRRSLWSAKRERWTRYHGLVSINPVVLGRAVDDLVDLLVHLSRGKSIITDLSESVAVVCPFYLVADTASAGVQLC